MKLIGKVMFGTLFGLLFTSGLLLAQQEDLPDSKDHPLLTRMPDFYISGYEDKEFDQADFKTDQGEDIKVEGHKYHIEYDIKKGKKAPSELQILKNYENAIKKIGGSKSYEAPGEAWLKLEAGGKITWIYLYAHCDGECYELTIIEQKRMVQEVIANAKSLAQSISSTGHASVYGIHFDFNKANVKPESDPTLKEITKLLKQNTKLKLYVVGHTDNVGKIGYNMKLSQKRAESVVKALVIKYGVAKTRLDPHGVGPLAPVASNATEQGRALNRRVELVKE